MLVKMAHSENVDFEEKRIWTIINCLLGANVQLTKFELNVISGTIGKKFRFVASGISPVGRSTCLRLGDNLNYRHFPGDRVSAVIEKSRLLQLKYAETPESGDSRLWVNW